MSYLTDVTDKVRNLVNDNLKSETDVFVYTGASTLFTLSEGNVDSIAEVLVNDTESGVTYTSSTNLVKLDITSNLEIDDVIEVTYNCYSNYSDSEILAYILSAFVYISTANFKSFSIQNNNIYPAPTIPESNLIALMASVLIDPQNVSYRMPDVGVTMPKDLNTYDKISKILSAFKRAGNVGEAFISEDTVATES